MITEICGHASLACLLRERPGEYDLLLITNPGYELSQDVKPLARRVLHLEFDDVTAVFAEFPDIHAPSAEHVARALEWASGSDCLVVACHAGISRSSALAYVIRCRDLSPREAIKVLDWHTHAPNELIVSLGAELLQNPAVMETFRAWQSRDVVD